MSVEAVAIQTTQEKLRQNKRINTQLDLMASAMTNGKRVKPVLVKRSGGRPRGGVVVFSKALVDNIPAIGYPGEIARALGIKRISVQQWCDLKKNPLPYATSHGHYVLRRDVILKWLVNTGRYNPKG